MERWLELYADACFRRSADTAHDLKTPLNIAVLNLELLRMRVRKLAGDEDPKVDAYAKAIELELRKLARIFDAFFVYSVPPKGETNPEHVDMAEIVRDVLAPMDLPVEMAEGSCPVFVFRSRARDLVRLFAEGTLKILDRHKIAIGLFHEDQMLKLRISGDLASGDIDVEKLFKFYYSDPAGVPELSLATARLIAETCGGSVELERSETNALTFELTLPAGER